MATQRISRSSLEVHVYLVLRDAAGHELTIATENVTTIRFHAYTIALQTVGHLCPVVFFDSHNIHGFANHGKTNQCQHYCNGEVARHDLIILEFTHPVSVYSGTFII